MPEGDALHRAARRLQVLVGEELEVETPHPRGAVTQLDSLLDGRRLDRVEAIGKNLLLHFEGGVTVRSHLGMKGRWRVFERETLIAGRPWLILRGERHVGAMFNGAALVRYRGELNGLGPDILFESPQYDAMVWRLRAIEQTREIGDALLDQRVVAGIGNMWKAEALWAARVSPWRTLADVTDEELHATLQYAHRLMAERLNGARPNHQVYRRKGRPCPRCRAPIRSWPQGEGARMAYWCPSCQSAEPPQ